MTKREWLMSKLHALICSPGDYLTDIEDSRSEINEMIDQVVAEETKPIHTFSYYVDLEDAASLRGMDINQLYKIANHHEALIVDDEYEHNLVMLYRINSECPIHRGDLLSTKDFSTEVIDVNHRRGKTILWIDEKNGLDYFFLADTIDKALT